MTGNLILNDRPLLISPTLAAMIGLNESIVLQQLHYWMLRSKNIREDRKWVYFTYDELGQQFPFFSISTIRRAISNLVKHGFVSTKNFNKMKMDQTKWYTIHYEHVEELKHEEDNLQNDVDALEPVLEPICSDSTDELSKVSSPCVQNEQSSCSSWTEDAISLNTAIPESTSEITTKNTSETSSSSKQENDPYPFFEQNGFGKIGNYYARKIKTWCTELSDELVIEAMKLALENGSTRWNYVEAVLTDWSNKGIQTVDEMLEARRSYNDRKQQNGSRKPVRKELLPDWVKHEDYEEKPVYNLDFEAKKRLWEERKKAYC